ncbi:MAG: oligosaccharyl transferase subunit ost3/OST6 [Cyphobasidiales sp. Tagirdzhanova-0007]|nr:MAG: oligosaccharyl transferase subunit ost3/OST6 [Cyphobasidiales sp. Tagirdzhanova-0007]
MGGNSNGTNRRATFASSVATWVATDPVNTSIPDTLQLSDAEPSEDDVLDYEDDFHLPLGLAEHARNHARQLFDSDATKDGKEKNTKKIFKAPALHNFSIKKFLTKSPEGPKRTNTQYNQFGRGRTALVQNQIKYGDSSWSKIEKKAQARVRRQVTQRFFKFKTEAYPSDWIVDQAAKGVCSKKRSAKAQAIKSSAKGKERAASCGSETDGTVKPQDSDPRVSKFHSLAAKHSGVVLLTSSLYDELLSPTTPRNYSASVILTALDPKYGCVPCRQFDKEHKDVARQWWSRNKRNKNEQSRHFFAVLDFEAGQDVFRRLGLNTAPLGQLFIPSSSQAIQYDFGRSGPSAEAFASFLSQNTGLPITFDRPIDYSILVSSITGIAIVASGAFLFWNFVKIFLLSRWLWAVLSLAFILPMVSGYMWNQIRKPPYMQVTREGAASYISGGFSNQYGVETPIISMIYGVLAFSTYTIAVTLPNLSNNKLKQRLGVYIWLSVIIVMASVLVAIFQVKNPGYPFKLLF